MIGDISIIITNYNKPTYQIEECFDSVESQTVRPKEVIFVDDYSHDRNYASDYLSIMIPKNRGVSYARNIGFRISTGKTVLFLDADDKLAPDFLEQCGRVIAKSDIVYPNMLYFGDLEINQLKEAPKNITPEYIIGRKLEIPVTSLMHRDVFESVGGFKDLPVYEDWDFWIKAMRNGYTFTKANTLLWYRQSNDSRNNGNKELRNKIHSQITANYLVKEGVLCQEKESN